MSIDELLKLPLQLKRKGFMDILGARKFRRQIVRRQIVGAKSSAPNRMAPNRRRQKERDPSYPRSLFVSQSDWPLGALIDLNSMPLKFIIVVCENAGRILPGLFTFVIRPHEL